MFPPHPIFVYYNAFQCLSVQYLMILSWFFLDIGTPVITTSPPANNTTEGDNLALACKASGQPVPTYQWYQNNQLLSNLSVLTLPNVKISQSGEYVCKASGGGVVHKETAVDIKIQCKYKILFCFC